MNPLPDNPADRLDAYLDGTMAATDRAAFERRVWGDPALRRELALARRIEGSLRGRFAPPPVAWGALVEPEPEPVVARIGAARGARWAVAAAACVALLAAAAVYLAGRGGSGLGHGPRPATIAEALYRGLDHAYKPERLWTDAGAFVAAVAERFGEPLAIEPAPGLALVGWSEVDNRRQGLPVVSERTLVVVSTIGGRRVVGLIDRAGAGVRPGVSARSGLSLFERQVGGLVLYEITPWAESRLLARFASPDHPERNGTEASPVRRCPSPAP